MNSKIREAVSRLVKEVEGEILPDISSATYYDFMNALLDDIKTALAEPLRNCDAFSKAEVLEVLDDRSFSKEDTIEWLFDEAKGEAE